MATVYCGVDFHARKQTVSYLTTEDGEMQQIELLHEQDDVGGFYAQLQTQGQVIVGFESSGYAAWASSLITTNPSPPRRPRSYHHPTTTTTVTLPIRLPR